MTDAQATRLINWIAKIKFYKDYQNKWTKEKARDQAREWLNNECEQNNWTREICIRASKHSACTGINKWKELCNYYKNETTKR